MPIILTAQQTLQVRRQGELFRVEISVSCDGASNLITAITRHHAAVSRDVANTQLNADPTPISKAYAMSDFGAAVQTGLQNLVNALDVKP